MEAWPTDATMGCHGTSGSEACAAALERTDKSGDGGRCAAVPSGQIRRPPPQQGHPQQGHPLSPVGLTRRPSRTLYHPHASPAVEAVAGTAAAPAASRPHRTKQVQWEERVSCQWFHAGSRAQGERTEVPLGDTARGAMRRSRRQPDKDSTHDSLGGEDCALPKQEGYAPAHKKTRGGTCQFCKIEIGGRVSKPWACCREVSGSVLARAISVVCVSVLLVLQYECLRGADLPGNGAGLLPSSSPAHLRDCSLVLLLLSFALEHFRQEAQGSCCCECAHSGLGFRGFFYRTYGRGLCMHCERRLSKVTARYNNNLCDGFDCCSEGLEHDELIRELERQDLGSKLASPARREPAPPERAA